MYLRAPGFDKTISSMFAKRLIVAVKARAQGSTWLPTFMHETKICERETSTGTGINRREIPDPLSYVRTNSYRIPIKYDPKSLARLFHYLQEIQADAQQINTTFTRISGALHLTLFYEKDGAVHAPNSTLQTGWDQLARLSPDQTTRDPAALRAGLPYHSFYGEESMAYMVLVKLENFVLLPLLRTMSEPLEELKKVTTKYRDMYNQFAEDCDKHLSKGGPAEAPAFPFTTEDIQNDLNDISGYFSNMSLPNFDEETSSTLTSKALSLAFPTQVQGVTHSGQSSNGGGQQRASRKPRNGDPKRTQPPKNNLTSRRDAAVRTDAPAFDKYLRSHGQSRQEDAERDKDLQAHIRSTMVFFALLQRINSQESHPDMDKVWNIFHVISIAQTNGEYEHAKREANKRCNADNRSGRGKGGKGGEGGKNMGVFVRFSPHKYLSTVTWHRIENAYVELRKKERTYIQFRMLAQGPNLSKLFDSIFPFRAITAPFREGRLPDGL